MVERGFCKNCGTPLTYRQIDGVYISLTLNSLDNPEAVQPELSFASDCKARWLQSLDNLPEKAMDLTISPGFVSHQAP